MTRTPTTAGWAEGRQAIAFFIASGLVFSVLDAYVKAVVASFPVVGTLFARAVVFMVVLVLISGRSQPRQLVVSRAPVLQLVRGMMLFVATLLFFFALSLLPLGEVVALGSVSPLIVVMLAGPFLHEQVTRVAISGTLVGTVGVLILVGFDPRGFDAWSLLPLISALSFAGFSILSRAVGHEREEVTLFYTGATGLGLAALAVVVFWPGHEATIIDWVAAGGVGALSLIGHRLLATAYRRGRASDLAPFGYLALVWGFLIGAVFFGEPIEPSAVVGAAAIALGGLIAIRGVSDRSPEMAMAAQPGLDVAVDEDDDAAVERDEVAAAEERAAGAGHG